MIFKKTILLNHEKRFALKYIHTKEYLSLVKMQNGLPIPYPPTKTSKDVGPRRIKFWFSTSF